MEFCGDRREWRLRILTINLTILKEVEGLQDDDDDDDILNLLKIMSRATSIKKRVSKIYLSGYR